LAYVSTDSSATAGALQRAARRGTAVGIVREMR
jgi:hypothetical protein